MKTARQLKLQQLAFSFPEKQIFSDVNLSVEAGTIASLQGRNGTGKSTLLKCIAGIAAPSAGIVMVDGHEISRLSPLERSRYIGALWTDRVRLNGFTLRDVVRMGTYNAQNLSSADELESTTDACLEALGIQELAGKPMNKLSDGELQKGMIARALAQQPSFLLLDEPTTYLDYVAREELMQTLQYVSRSKNLGILFTSHDLDIIRNYSAHRYEMNRGTLCRLA